MFDDRPNKSRAQQPSISMYLMSDDAPAMEKISCMFCKRTIADVKGRIDKVISTPMSVQEFDVAINVRCKLCKQDYRLLVNTQSVPNGTLEVQPVQG